MTHQTDALLAAACASNDPAERSTLLLAAAEALAAEGLHAKAATCRKLALEEASHAAPPREDPDTAPFCACGRRASECNGSRKGCRLGLKLGEEMASADEQLRRRWRI